MRFCEGDIKIMTTEIDRCSFTRFDTIAVQDFTRPIKC